MSLKTYLFFMLLGTILCIASFVFVVMFINPRENGWMAFALFYSSLFFGLTGLFSLIGFFIRRRLNNNEVLYANVGIAFRQAILLSLLIIILMILQQFGELNLIKGGLVVLVIFLIELFFNYFRR